MMPTTYDYFEHEADIGVIGRGPTMEAAFVAAAQAMFAIMGEPAQVDQTLSIATDFEETDPELALVTWLNRLLTQAGLQGAVFSRFELAREGDRYQGRAFGSPWSEAMERGTEVKGATLTALSVKRTDGEWEARCVVDV
jgi:SHS2 domain-containing protein